MQDYLKALTAPSVVALVGASDTPSKLTARPLSFLKKHGFTGKIFPVNPMRDTVQEFEAYPSVADIPETVEHAYLLVGTDYVVPALRDCAAAGVKVVSVLADGFAEAGPEGRARQAEIVKIAKDAGILLIGPNSTGVVDTRNGFSCTTNAAFQADSIKSGRLAVISQSGSLIGTLLSRGSHRGVHFSTLVSVGNEAVAGVGELGAVLLEDEGTNGFILFMETIRDADALADFARRAYKIDKPVVAYMLGKSDEGQALAVSHTGALTGGAEAMCAFMNSIGIAQVNQFEALFESPAALSKRCKMKHRPKKVTVLSTTGGGGAMVIDQLSLRGVDIAGCSEASRQILTTKEIPLGHGKLVDVTLAGTKYDTMKAVVSQLIADPETGALVVAIGSSAQFNPELAVTPIVDAVAEANASAAPVFAFPIPHAEESIRMLEAGGVPSFRSVESCADTVALVINGADPTPLVDASLPQKTASLLNAATDGVLNEVEAGAVFATLGLNRPAQVFLEPEAIIKTGDLRFPVVTKLVSEDLPHKTEMGAIRIGLQSQEDLVEAVRGMKSSVAEKMPEARIQGVLVQEMCRGLGEALIGITRDPLVGPVITVAAGGVMTEIYKDASVRPAPVSVETAREMVDEVKAFAVLRGYRGKPKGDLEALAQAVSAVSKLAARSDIVEAEVNPVLVGKENEGVVLLDALIRKD